MIRWKFNEWTLSSDKCLLLTSDEISGNVEWIDWELSGRLFSLIQCCRSIKLIKPWFWMRTKELLVLIKLKVNLVTFRIQGGARTLRVDVAFQSQQALPFPLTCQSPDRQLQASSDAMSGCLRSGSLKLHRNSRECWAVADIWMTLRVGTVHE